MDKDHAILQLALAQNVMLGTRLRFPVIVRARQNRATTAAPFRDRTSFNQIGDSGLPDILPDGESD